MIRFVPRRRRTLILFLLLAGAGVAVLARDGPDPLLVLHREPAQWFWGLEAVRIGEVDGYAVDEIALGLPDAHDGGELRGAVQVQTVEGRVLWRRAGEVDGERFGAWIDAPGDVDGDGCPDLFVSTESFRSDVAVTARLLSGEDGHHLRSFRYRADARPEFVAGVGRVDGDECADWIQCDPVVSLDQPSTVSIRSGRDASVLCTLTPARQGESLVAPVGAAGDVDGDGAIDCFAAIDGRFALSVHRTRDGAHLFDIEAPGRITRVSSAGDMDQDGADELWVATGFIDKIHLHAGRTGSLLHSIQRSEQMFSELGRTIARVGDLDGDGADDLVAGAPSYDGGNSADPHLNHGKLYVFSGRTGRRIGGKRAGWTEWQLGMALLSLPDLDGDGRNEVLSGSVDHESDRSWVEARVYSSADLLD